MFDSILNILNEIVLTLLGLLVGVLQYPFAPGQRIFWLYLVSSLFLAYFVYRSSNQADAKNTLFTKSFLNFLFPREIWENPSAWLDIRYFFFHQVVRLMIYGVFLAEVMAFMFNLLTGETGAIPESITFLESDLGHILFSTVYMFLLIAFIDFISFGMHYLQHKIPFLWEFHKVHHSLEVMHPISNYREHPVDNIFYMAGTGTAYGLFLGGVYLLFGYLPTMPQILGVPLLSFAFNMLGYNLRHSHIWLRWPGNWSMAFASPAHHHIHHSCHPDHIDKNFAFIFPIWDVVFKTYHLPETNKDVHFGISKTYVSEYKSILALYFLPFIKVANLHKKAVKTSKKTSS
ncbi:sterol desaturase family protein [Kiloniella majae]|uniref:sterol desaturase family protein n=1 Tax=Kiloniella majae TaxID=1938558 RepID=UPI000A2783C8|nr:sterol desaturase family protein [Kiloniella majae]